MGVICDNTYSAISSLSSVATDSSMSGNGTIESPLGVVRYPVELLWSGTGAVNYSAALTQPITNYQYLDLWGSGGAAGMCCCRIPVVSPFNSSYMSCCVWGSTPWNPATGTWTNYAFIVGQKLKFPSTTSFSAFSSFYFGCSLGGVTSYEANNQNRTGDIRLMRVYGVGYGKGV